MKRTLLLSFIITVLLVVISPLVLAADMPFSDTSLYKWENGIEFVYNRGIVEGYPDGTYQPDRTLNRAELLKVIVASSYPQSSYASYEGDTCFDDIDGTQWYTKYVCFGKAEGIVEGYPDGTFKPEQEVNFVEALKIMLIGMNVDLTSSASDPWYQMYYDTADLKYLIPDELEGAYANDFSRGQAAEVIKRIISLDAEIVQPPVYVSEGGYEPGTVYIGYLQEGDILDLYFIADSYIDEYMEQNVPFSLSGHDITDYSIDRQTSFVYAGEDVATMYMGLTVTPLHANEIRHIVTLYLTSSDPVTIITD